MTLTKTRTETTMELLLALAKEEGRHSNIEGTSCTSTPLPCTNYYQSVFRIDGQPILPPLMTKEKRFEMMKFKEVAIEREARKRQLRQCSNAQSREAGDTVTLVNETFVSNAANRFYDALHTQPLNDTPKLNCEPKKYINASTCTDIGITVECKRVQHLQRSETIIYDNRCNSIIMPLNAVHELRQGGQALIVAEESENVVSTAESMSLKEGTTSKTTKTQSPKIISAETSHSPKRPQSLLFDTSPYTQQQQIPEICVNPPTPQVDPRVQSALHTHNFVDVSPKCAAMPRQLDDKCKCPKSQMQVSNNISKINQFKNSAVTSLNMKTKSPCCDDKLKRSITSPSLKIVGKSAPHAINNNKNKCLNISSMSDEKAQCLTRSNSFTLERPSKVLLEHMERQQTWSQRNTLDFPTKSTDIKEQQSSPQQLMQKHQSVTQTRSPNNANLNHHAHFRRDTVESKAKRVNKIEVKQRMAPVRNTAKFKQKATATTTRPITVTSKIYRATVSAVSSPNTSSSLNAHHLSPSNNNNAHQIYGNSTNHSLSRNNSSNTTTQPASVTSLPLNKNKRTVYEPRAVSSQPQQPQAEQMQLPTKRTPKKVVNTARSPSATLQSRALVNTTQGSAKQPQLHMQHLQTDQQFHQQNQQQPSANYNSQHDQHANSQTLEKQLQLKLQQLQQQRQLARSTMSPTVMSQEMLSEIETAHRQKFMQLIAQQHEEQRRLQAQFDAQQKLLLEQICTEMSTSQLSGDDGHLFGGEYTTDSETRDDQHNESNSSTSDSPGDSVSSVVDTCRDSSKSLTSPSATINVSHIAKVETTTIRSGDSTAASTPRSLISVSGTENDRSGCNRQTSHNSSLHLNNNNGNSGDGSGVNSARKRLHFGNTTQQLDFVLISDRAIQPNRHTLSRSSTGSLPETKRPTDQTSSITITTRPQIINETEMLEQKAATKINAGARGYLVRRLFRTEQIQRIVQTIRDTLIFVLNLHLETSDKEAVGADEDTPANVRLKARLLQQLCSASRTLHLVFFQTTLKERMEIISRDRKRLRSKMMAIHLKRSTHIK